MIERTILDAAIARVAISEFKNELLLRGSYLTSHWIGADVRKCDDLDFLSLGPVRFDRITYAFKTLLAIELSDHIQFDSSRIAVEKIFEETNAPGLRLIVPVNHLSNRSTLQIDIAFNDPLPEAPTETAFETANGQFTLYTPSPELAFGWKLHGLVEREGLSWRAKDMADLWLLQNHFQFDSSQINAAIKIAFESRDGPLWRLNRLLNCEMGKSGGSRRRYLRFLRDFTNEGFGYPTEVSQLVADVARAISVPINQLRQDFEEADTTPFGFPVGVTLSEMQAACGQPNYRHYSWNDGSTIVRERRDPEWIPLHHAATFNRHSKLLHQNEARGITFNVSGQLTARPYAQFEKQLTVNNVDRINQHRINGEQFASAEVLEKLDGSMVFPMPDQNSNIGWRLRTRRGKSGIADCAMSFALEREQAGQSQFTSFIERCLAKRQTPIFEWCSRSRWIIFDHPVDRLVLTGIRDNHLGTLLPYGELTAIASCFQIELVRRLAKPRTLRELVEAIECKTESEGCVLRLQNGRQFKIKSHRYTWLHRAIEGPNRDRARWYLWATGAGAQLIRCSAGRNLFLNEYLQQLDNAADNFIEPIRKLVSKFDPTAIDSRKTFAASILGQESLYKRLAFCAFDGASLKAEIRSVIAKRCQNEQLFGSIAKKLDGPIWND